MPPAPLLGPSRPTALRFKLGAFEITNVTDGQIQQDGPHPIFGADQQAEAMHALMRANRAPETRFEHAFTPTLVNTGKDLILFDAGNGELRPGMPVGKLADNMRAAGLPPEDVTVVVITHGHPDHIAGLVKDGKPAFPNARLVFGAREFDYWRKGENIPEGRKPTMEAFHRIAVPFGERATMLEPGQDVVPGIRAVEAFGHSPGMLGFTIESEGRALLLAADVLSHYLVSPQRPGWHVFFDQDKEQAAATRKRFLEMSATDGLPFIGFHLPFPCVGYIERGAEPGSYRYVAAGYQLNL